ncbi:MAG: hypothetical protein ACLQCB_05085 [Spirochaetia bacterium]
MGPIFNRLAESISSTWRLLSDTTNFLSRVKLLDQYETELRGWRERLSRNRNNPQVAREIRDDIVALRKLLRSRGYDLRLGSKDIIIEGWRHDDAMAEGFRRIVLGAAEDDVYYVAGDANHNDLAEALESQCRARRGCKPFSLHCLWYRWRTNVLVLSGAASETAEQFEEFRRYFDINKDLLLRKLSGL